LKTIILHIGLPKTGTTFIQQSLARNRDRLLDQGFAYYLDPDYLDCTSSIEPNQSVGLCLCGDDPDEFFRDAVWRRFMRFIQETPADNVVVSSESLASGQVDVEFVSRQLSHVRVRVIAYLRDEVELLASVYAEMVKNGELSCTLEELYNGAPLLVDYRDRLKSWFSVFGEKTVELCHYDLASRSSGGLFAHFLSRIGLSALDFEQWDTPSGRPNRRWPQAVIELQRQFNGLSVTADEKWALREQMRLLLLHMPRLRELSQVNASEELISRIRRDSQAANGELWRRCM